MVKVPRCMMNLVFYFLLAPIHSLRMRSPQAFPDDRFNASSFLDDANSPGRPEKAWLNNMEGSWCPLHDAENQWLEVDLGSNQTIYGVAVQQSHDSSSKVTHYDVGLRADGAQVGTWVLQKVAFLLQFDPHLFTIITAFAHTTSNYCIPRYIHFCHG